jgi:hypothetical protein
VDEKQLAKDLFNYVWTLLDKERRTRAEDDEAKTYTRLAADAGERIGDAEDREHFDRNLASRG